MKFFSPHPKYPTVSITGRWCELACDYCRRLVLLTMAHADSPDRLYSLCKRLKERGGNGLLLSGGFSKDGKLPFTPFLDTIRRVKNELGLIISIHPGYVNKDEAIQLKDAGIDIAEYYAIYSDNVLRNVMHTSLSKEDVTRALDVLYTYGPKYISPHITIGADGGKVSWELDAIKIVKDYDPYVLIFLILVPIRGTPMAKLQPPSINDVLTVFSKARKELDGTELILGCMRPWGKYTQILESELIGKGLVDRIANPTLKYQSDIIETCCSLPNDMIMEIRKK